MRRKICIGLAAALLLCSLSVFSACGGSAEVEFQLNDDGTSYSVSGISGNKSALKNYEIPAEHEGLPVTRVEDEAFWRCTSLRSVTLPDGITYIGDRAFAQCAISEIVIPDTVTEIGYAAFGMCESLKEITVPESVTVLEARAFYACTALEKVYFKAGVADIGVGTFENTYVVSGGDIYTHTSLKEVYLCAAVKKIHYTAFSGNFLTDIYFAGSEEQWEEVYFYQYGEDEEGNSVEKRVEDKSEVLSSGITVHYNAQF